MTKAFSLVLAVSIAILSSLALTTDAFARGHGGHHGGHGHRGHHGHHGVHHGGHRHWHGHHGGHRGWHGGRGYRAGWYGHRGWGWGGRYYGPRYGVHRCRTFARFPTYPYRRCVRYW